MPLAALPGSIARSMSPSTVQNVFEAEITVRSTFLHFSMHGLDEDVDEEVQRSVGRSHTAPATSIVSKVVDEHVAADAAAADGDAETEDHDENVGEDVDGSGEGDEQGRCEDEVVLAPALRDNTLDPFEDDCLWGRFGSDSSIEDSSEETRASGPRAQGQLPWPLVAASASLSCAVVGQSSSFVPVCIMPQTFSSAISLVPPYGNLGSVERVGSAGGPLGAVPEQPGARRSRQTHQSRMSRRTTVMLRNLPYSSTRGALVELLSAEGFAGKFDFVYLPIDWRTHVVLGYAFVNLTSPEEAERFYSHFDGFVPRPTEGGRSLSSGWSFPYQGFADNVKRYRDSPLMHELVPDAYRPAIFSNGFRVPFPPPTKKVKCPRQGKEKMLVSA